MPLSRYLKIFPDPDNPGQFILYSTRKGSVLRATQELLTAAEEGTLSDEELAVLTRLEIVVPDPAAELADMQALVSRTNQPPSRRRSTTRSWGCRRP